MPQSKPRGFALLPPARRKEISRLGAIAAHKKGTPMSGILNPLAKQDAKVERSASKGPRNDLVHCRSRASRLRDSGGNSSRNHWLAMWYARRVSLPNV